MCAIAGARALIQVLRRDIGRMSLGEDLSDIDAVSLTTSSTVTGAMASIDELGMFHRIVATMDAAGQQWRRSKIVVLMLDTFDMKKSLRPCARRRQSSSASGTVSFLECNNSLTIFHCFIYSLFIEGFTCFFNVKFDSRRTALYARRSSSFRVRMYRHSSLLLRRLASRASFVCQRQLFVGFRFVAVFSGAS